MTDRPIIFSAPMILALLAGRKTMTRRLAWRAPLDLYDLSSEQIEGADLRGWKVEQVDPGHPGVRIWKPSPWQKVKPGDRLWVRESTAFVHDASTGEATKVEGFAADGYAIAECDAIECNVRMRPSIHMPRWASRLTLVVTATKIERVQDITMEDMIAEGLTFRGIGKAEHTMAAALRVCDELNPKWEALWKKLHGGDSWDQNPEVVALTFTVHKKNIDAMPKEKAA